MTRTAIYSLQDNALREQPAIPEPRELDFYSTSVYTGEPSFDDNGLAKAIAEYREHLDNLRTIPCHESARPLWKDGQRLEFEKDYRVESICAFYKTGCSEQKHCEDCRLVAFPLPVKSEQSEEELWRELIDKMIDKVMNHQSEESFIAEVKSQFIITKR